MADFMTNHVYMENNIRLNLVEMAKLLQCVFEVYWERRINFVLSAPTIDIGEVLSWYGGMGSLSDLIIAQINGHSVDRAQEKSINEKFDELRNKIYALALSLHNRP